MDLFDKIINKEISSDILYEDDKVIAIMDINPKRKGHFLVIPKEHSTNLIDISDDDYLYAMKIARKLAKEMMTKLNVSGFNLIVNNGLDAGQEVFHTHIHIIPTNK